MMTGMGIGSLARPVNMALRGSFVSLPSGLSPRTGNSEGRRHVLRQSRNSRAQRLQLQASSSSAEVKVDGGGVATGSPYVPLIAAAGFAATWFKGYAVQSQHVLYGLAAIALAQSALSLVNTGVHQDWVSNVAAPAVLAWHALRLQYGYIEAAIAVFGWYLCKNMEGPSLAWAATLAAALYMQKGALWYAGAYGVVAGWKLFQGYQNDSQLPIQLLPPVLASTWAIYKNAPFQWTIVLMLAQIAGSALSMALSIFNNATD